MELQVLCGLLFCFLLPTFLLAASLFRYNALSFLYLLYLLLLPWFPCPNKHTLRGRTGGFIKALLSTSFLFLLAHIVFQICYYTIPTLQEELSHNCSRWETLSRHIGVSRLPLEQPWNVLRLISPDLAVFIVSLVTLVLCKRLLKQKDETPDKGLTNEPEPEEGLTNELEPAEGGEEGVEFEEEDGEDEGRSCFSEPEEGAVRTKHAALLTAGLRATAQRLLRDMGRVLCVVLLALAGITVPSACSGVYYVLFIGVCTWWACHFPISHLGFSAFCVLVAIFSAGHLVCLYVYQTAYAQQIFPPAGLWARLFGFKDIIKAGNCSVSSSYDITLNKEQDWPVYVDPGILFLLYITVTVVLKLENRYPAEQEKEGQSEGSEADELESKPRGAQVQGSRDDTRQMLISDGESVDCESEKSDGLKINGPAHQPLAGISGAPSGEDGDHPVHIVGRMIMQQSYVCALIAMMVWSITYHSWLTFVFLLWACLIWMVRARRHFATLCSPFILLYGLSLCFLQYVWAMDLEPELPQHWGSMSVRQLGLDRAPYPCLRLGAMLLYTLTFWLLLRQSVKNNFSKKKSAAIPLLEVTTGESGRQKEPVLKTLGAMVMSCYAKYWIYVCGGMFIMVSFAGKLVAYKIIYMLLFLLCLCLYQVYYTLWRRLLKAFWWLVVAYTMLVLIAIYTFQFEDFPGYWKNFTGFTEQQLADLGLEMFKLSELFSSILIPGFFLLACILQLHYFHHRFMKITDLEHVTPIHKKETVPSPDGVTAADGPGLDEVNAETDLEGDDLGNDGMTPTKWGLVMDRLMVLLRTFLETLTQVQVFIWRLLEMHILKIVAFFIVWVALGEPSVMNSVLVVLWSFSMPYARFRHMASILSAVWVCIIIVCKMLYQLSVINPIQYSRNCTVPLLNETNLRETEIFDSILYKEPVDPANWFGFRKDATALGYSKNHLLVLVLLVFEATVYRHQVHHYKQHQCSPPPIPAIFPNSCRDTLDQGILPCLKYLLNYFFYKFGLEICFLMTVNVIGQRMNFLVIVHGCWLVVILTRRRRAAIAQIWPKYCLFLALFMIYQYFLCVGLPPALCKDYPWRWNTPVTINSALIKWIYLPDFYTIPNSKNLIADFLLLMCASLQWKVFEDEKIEEWMVLAGENTDEPDPMEGRPFNPAPNFINCRSYLDMAKVLVFRYMFWLVLSVVFVTGATRISVFGMGYLLACFYFLLFGTQMLTRPSKSRLALWDCLIMYNVCVIIAKNVLSILACVFVEQMQAGFCWVIQLFSLVCTVKGYYDPKAVSGQDCVLPVEEAGIIWDSICFFFLLLQRRVFLSFYFLHVTADLRASALQASRGFELFRASVVKRMKFHQQAESKSLTQLKRSMERIRSKQQKYKTGRHAHEVKEEDQSEESAQDKSWWSPWVDHASVLHSGEYYLFESDSEEEDLQTEDLMPPEQSASQLAYQAWVTNIKSALRDRQQRQRELYRLRRERERETSSQTSDDEEEEEVFLLEGEEPIEEESSGRRSETVQRVLDILKFLWVLFGAMVDGVTQWLHLLTKQYVDTSTVLCNQRYYITHNISQEDQTSEDSEAPTIETCLDDLDTCNTKTSSLASGMEPEAGTDTACTTPQTPEYGSATFCSEPTLELEPEPEPRTSPRSRRNRTASEILADRQYFVEELIQSQQFYASQNRALKLLFALYKNLNCDISKSKRVT
ncbi:hypothetical protein GJAV_G00234400 [Gymnothorax javanicus]|nr:hypothetical protein GJAV_G00234400 [Gymnothorax javanicus]